MLGGFACRDRVLGVRLALLATFLGACGGLGVERYRESRPNHSVRIQEVAPCQPGDTPIAVATSLARAVPVCTGRVLVRASDIQGVQLLSSDRDNAVVVLVLTDRGRARMATVAENTTLAVVVDGQVEALPHVHNELVTSELYLQGPPGRARPLFERLVDNPAAPGGAHP